jgi:hypothetical protein
MSFIGNVPAESYSPVVKDTFSGNDSTTDFTLSIPATTNSVEVFVENVQQEPTEAYTIAGTTLSFTAAPVTGTDNIYVIHRGPAVQQIVPPGDSITTAMIQDGAVTAAKIDSLDKISEGNSSVEVVDAGTGKIEFTVDAVEIADFTASAVVFNESGADVDFRIESDTDANALFVEGSSGNVGIGTSSPAALLDVRAFATANIRIGSTGTDLGNNTEIGTLEFFNSDGDQNAVAAYVRAIRGSSFGSGGLLTFATSESGSPAGTIAERMRIDSSGAVTIGGSLSKGSGSFKIDHPLKPETHHLVHSFVEAPQADNIYRGKVDLVNGTATVNIDTVAGMTEGTFVALNREVQCFTSNESGWTAVRGSVSGNTLTIEAQDNTCTDTVSWMVVGERQDQHMYDTGWTDENGKVIVEPEKPTTEEVTGETP